MIYFSNRNIKQNIHYFLQDIIGFTQCVNTPKSNFVPSATYNWKGKLFFSLLNSLSRKFWVISCTRCNVTPLLLLCSMSSIHNIVDSERFACHNNSTSRICDRKSTQRSFYLFLYKVYLAWKTTSMLRKETTRTEVLCRGTSAGS